jgi:ferredoxin
VPYVIYDANSKQWVGQVDGKFTLVPGFYLAHRFLFEAMAGAVLGQSFANPPFQCVIQLVPSEGEIMAARGAFEPALLSKFWTDFQAGEPAIQAVFLDLWNLSSGAAAMMARAPLPRGCTDCGQCLECAISCQTQALASAVMAQRCLAAPTP